MEKNRRYFASQESREKIKTFKGSIVEEYRFFLRVGDQRMRPTVINIPAGLADGY